MTDSGDASTTDASLSERALLGDRMRDARNYLGLTQEEVAGYLKIPRTALIDIESGRRRVDVLELAQLAKLYRQPIAYFTGEEKGAEALPPDVEYLAREVAEMSQEDRAELGRFARYLRARARTRE